MKIALNFCLALVLLFALGFDSVDGQETPAALNFTMKSINGDDVELSKYAGKVVVIVNVASECGYTKQYKQLQELHANYHEQGVEVVGIPCNQFGGQEPGSEKEILEFCESKFGVEFDMMSKVDVNGENQSPLYQHLNSLELKPAGKGPVKWNFEKFILDKSGQPIARFGTRVSPDSDEFMTVIKKAIGKPLKTSTKPYSHLSQKSGKTYYLFSKEVKRKNSDATTTIYFFASDPENKKGDPMMAVPDGKVVSETKSGMLVLKNQAGGGKQKQD